MGLSLIIILSIVVIIFSVIDVEAFYRTLVKNIRFVNGCNEPLPVPATEELDVAVGGVQLPRGLIRVIRN